MMFFLNLNKKAGDAMADVRKFLDANKDREVDTTAYYKELQEALAIVPPRSCVKFIKKFGGLQYRNKKFSTSYEFLKDYHYTIKQIGNSLSHYHEIYPEPVAPIGFLLSEIWGTFILVMNEKEEIYILEKCKKIAENVNEFLQIIFSEDQFINFEIEESTILQLKKAGWYEHRKIDLSSFLETLKSNGYPIFDSAVEFFSEFGGLSGTTDLKNVSWKIVNEIMLLEDFTPDSMEETDFRYRNPYEDYLPVCIYYNYSPTVGDFFYITESGRFFAETGKLMGNNPLEFFNTLFKY